MDTPARPALYVALSNFSASPAGDWQRLIDVATAADRVGIDGLVVSDHVVFGEHLEAYGRAETGGVDGGVQPTGPDGAWLEPMTFLSVLAGVTNDIRLSTNILLAALRRPVVLAKSAATLDVLSGGRLELGVGIGWQREEYDAAGLDFGTRGRLLDQTLEVCRALWRDEPASFSSDDVRFERIHCNPKPVHPNGVPILVSGRPKPRVLERLARHGTGWIPWGLSPEEAADAVPEVRQALRAAGRGDEPLDVRVSLRVSRQDPAAGFAAVPALAARGVTQFVVGAGAGTEDHLAKLRATFRESS